MLYHFGWMHSENDGPWAGSIPIEMGDRPAQVWMVYQAMAATAVVGLCLTWCSLVPRYRRTFFQYKTAKVFYLEVNQNFLYITSCTM